MADIGVDGDPLLRYAQEERFGHYQSNCAMGLARRLGKKPRDVAAALVEKLDLSDMCEPPQIAGPGFINLRLKSAFMGHLLGQVPSGDGSADDRLAIDRVASPRTIVVDLSSPNLAKEMHVGHLRSTVIGDCLARVLEFQGHTVVRENHVGDWGTQFGMLVAHLCSTQPEVAERPDDLVISDLEAFYIEAKNRFDADEAFQKQSRETVVALQQGDPTTRKIWKAFCEESLRHCHAIYERLGVRLIDRGESFYADMMADVVTRLEKMMADRDDGFVQVSDGALCLFMDGFTTRDGEPLPMIARKSDGGYNYATSDLATIIHRVETLKATDIIYVVGIAQKQHFDMLFAAARQSGWAGEGVSLTHAGFGNMLGQGGRPFKTREGGTVKLKDVLDDAVRRAREVLEAAKRDEARPERTLSAGEADQIAERVGLAAVKYFDLCHSLTTDYKFDVNLMLAMEGNTAPYMMYAYARIRSIERKAGVPFASLPNGDPLLLEHPTEVALGRRLLQFVETVDIVAADLRPNVLTDYLYELARSFSRFYDKRLGVRVIDASPEEVRVSRLRLCDLTARVLRVGLSLLGIETVERM